MCQLQADSTASQCLHFSTSGWPSLASTTCPPVHAQGEEAGGELSFLIEPKLDGERQQVRTAWRRRHEMARCTKCADCSRASLAGMRCQPEQAHMWLDEMIESHFLPALITLSAYPLPRSTSLARCTFWAWTSRASTGRAAASTMAS